MFFLLLEYIPVQKKTVFADTFILLFLIKNYKMKHSMLNMNPNYTWLYFAEWLILKLLR